MSIDSSLAGQEHMPRPLIRWDKVEREGSVLDRNWRRGPVWVNTSDMARIDDLVNFMVRFTDVPERPIPGACRYDEQTREMPVHLPSPGPRRETGSITIDLGTRVVVERMAFDDHPEGRLYLLAASPVEVAVLGWGVGDEELQSFTSRIRRLDDSLLEQFKRAQAVACERIGKAEH
jgi:hypothetical protein